jgi:hypothetical protein
MQLVSSEVTGMLSPAERRLRLLVKLGCAVDLFALLAFAGTMVYGFSNLSAFSDRFDPWLRVLQLLFLIGVVGTLVMHLITDEGLRRNSSTLESFPGHKSGSAGEQLQTPARKAGPLLGQPSSP